MFEGVEFSVDVVALVAVSVGAFGVIYSQFLRPMLMWITSMINSTKKIDEIYKQMFTNGGSSLKDQMNRIENDIVLLKKKNNLFVLDAPQAMYETNKAGECVWVNRTYCRMSSRTESELTGTGWINCIVERDRERVDKLWNYSVENEIEFSMIYDMVDSNGRVFTVRGKANPMKSPTGQLLGYIGVIEKVNG